MSAALKAIALLTVCLWPAFMAFSMAFWWLYPYPSNASQETIVFVWSVHVTIEKYLAFLISTIISVVAILKAHTALGKKSLVLGALAGLPFHLLGGAIYIYRFGLSAYLENSKPLGLLGIVLLLSFVASCIAYLAVRRADAQQGVPADRPRPAGSAGG